MIKIVIPGNPIPWRAAFVGRRGAFSPRTKILNDYRINVRSQYSGPLIESAVDCHVFCFMPIPKSTSKANRILMLEGKIRPISRPDRTNIAKLVEDSLNGIVISDDSIIVGGSVEKWYDERPRVELRIKKI
jgi:Holliday junction resolvase RusA-like endonuclease